MLNTQLYLVIKTDIAGNDYTTSVLMTPSEARDRIKDGRLLSAAAGQARNYARLWEAFVKQDRYGPTMGRMPTAKESEFINYKNQEKL